MWLIATTIAPTAAAVTTAFLVFLHQFRQGIPFLFCVLFSPFDILCAPPYVLPDVASPRHDEKIAREALAQKIAETGNHCHAYGDPGLSECKSIPRAHHACAFQTHVLVDMFANTRRAAQRNRSSAEEDDFHTPDVPEQEGNYFAAGILDVAHFPAGEADTPDAVKVDYDSGREMSRVAAQADILG
jgi:hypothetical protein